MIKSAFKSQHEIIEHALSFHPVAKFVGFSGGDDSLVTTHWMMTNVPGCRVFHANTGIGIERTRQYVRDTCKSMGWPLTEIRAKEDCGQDYREMVLKHGFPGPGFHGRMYQRLKERCVRLLVKRNKHRRYDKILIATGIRQDESQIRMGYINREVNFVGSQMWVNPLFHWTKSQFHSYIQSHNLPRNPISQILGMSGECLCGAFAHKGEKAMIRIVDPETADYIDQLERDVKAAGHDWGWEDHPPRKSPRVRKSKQFMPFCIGCTKTE
jgi:3'-phosphoadenosine 5'-phosphosulfate sulfotransferase (PAPS reductase)/FAD synthetase